MAAAILGSLSFWWLSSQPNVTLQIDMVLGLSKPSKAQIFWGGSGGGFVAERAAYFDVMPGPGRYRVAIPAEAGRLRVDPLNEPAEVQIRSMVFTRLGLPLRAWGGRWGFGGWRALNDVADLQVRGGTLHMRAVGPDPGIVLDAPLDLLRRRRMVDAAASLGLGLALGLLVAPALHAWWNRLGVARAARGLAQSVAILALGAGLTEVAMRVYHHYIPVFVFPSAGTDRFRGQPFGPDYAFHLNSHGFKDVEFEPRKRPGTVRILGLGDSFAFGVVPYESNYLTLLEKDLARAMPPAEVINMGIPAIGPRGYLEVLVNEGLPLHADMVLLSFFIGNDFQDEEPPPPRSYLFAFVRYMLAPKPKGVPIHGAGRYQDDAPNFEPAKYIEVERERVAIFRKSSPFLDEARPGVLSHLERIKRVCDGRGLELLLVLIPDEMQVNAELQTEVVSSYPGAAADFDFERPNHRLGADLHGLQIRYLDLLGPFREAGRTTRLYKPRDTHWNIAGNRLAANLIRDELVGGDVRFWPGRGDHARP